MIADFKKRFFIALVVTIPILALSPMIQDWFRFELDFPGAGFLLAALSTFIFLYGGFPFLKGAKEEIRTKSPGMMTLITMAISVAYFYSLATMLGLEGDDFFWELATLIAVMLLGHWIEMRSVLHASKSLDELAKLMPEKAHKIEGDSIVEVDVENLQKNDTILIRPGEKIPADGLVASGTSHVNESMLTGEARPIEKQKGDEIIGGSINGDGSLEVRVKGTGEDAYLSKVIDMVQKAQADKSKTQNLADKAAQYLTFIALFVGFTTLSVWLIISGNPTFAVARMATVMVIACPHALGLATPLVVANSTALSAREGLLIRNRTAFENAGKIDTVVFDKTGTLTHGEFGVRFVQETGDMERNRILQYAASIEAHSEHPIATGIVNEAKENGIKRLQAKNFRAEKGKGVFGEVDGKSVAILSPKALREKNLTPPKTDSKTATTDVFMVVDGTLQAVIGLGDRIRESSKDTIKALQALGIECWMLTGDNEDSAKAVADELNIDGYFAEVLPDDKLEKVKSLQQENRFVAMTGDGVNDAPALAQADVGIAIGSGTDVAAETADIILVSSDPGDVLALIRFGAATYRKMLQNLFWATAYNVVAIPLAAGVLAGIGFLISPAVGAIFMSLSTVVVAINAQWLKVQKK